MNGNGTCRRCGAAVVWVLTEAGKKMPIDLFTVPWPKGNLVVEVVNGEYRCRVVREQPEGPVYVSHFASCRPKKPPAKEP